MKHPLAEEQVRDAAFRQRYGRYMLVHLLSTLPLLIFAALVYGEMQRAPVLAISMTCAMYLAVLAGVHGIARREALAGLQREGIADGSYSPPES